MAKSNKALIDETRKTSGQLKVTPFGNDDQSNSVVNFKNRFGHLVKVVRYYQKERRVVPVKDDVNSQELG